MAEVQEHHNTKKVEYAWRKNQVRTYMGVGGGEGGGGREYAWCKNEVRTYVGGGEGMFRTFSFTLTGIIRF